MNNNINRRQADPNIKKLVDTFNRVRAKAVEVHQLQYANPEDTTWRGRIYVTPHGDVRKLVFFWSFYWVSDVDGRERHGCFGREPEKGFIFFTAESQSPTEIEGHHVEDTIEFLEFILKRLTEEETLFQQEFATQS